MGHHRRCHHRRCSLGRDAEFATLSGALTAAEAGQPAAVVVRGERGLGKTLLLSEVAAAAAGFEVVRHTASHAESGLAYAALDTLIRARAAAVEELPGPQRGAIRVAGGLEEGTDPGVRLVGLAVAHLLTASGRLLFLVDDAGLLDPFSAAALAVAARRMPGGRGVLLLATRPAPMIDDLFTGVATLTLRPLRHADMGRLLDRFRETPIDPDTRDRLLAECRGNPAVLTETLDHLGPAGLAGGFAVTPGDGARPYPQAVRDRMEHFAGLPDAARTVALLAAADPTGSPVVLRQAVAALGIPDAAVAAAENAGLIEIDLRVLFGHPLIRAAIYRRTGPGDRRAAHRALAVAVSSAGDPERHAWHAALAATRPDDDLAATLETRARRAGERWGVAATALLLERAAALTSEAPTGSELRRRAGRAWQQSGDLERARTVVAASGRTRHAELLLAQMTFDQRHGRVEAEQLVASAGALGDTDHASAVAACLRAVVGVLISGTPPARTRVTGLATTVTSHAAEPVTFAELALAAFTSALTGQPGPAATRARRAVHALTGTGDVSDGIDFMWVWLACVLAWDDVAALRWSRAYVDAVRRSGRLAQAPLALNCAAVAEMHAGRFLDAEHLSLRAAAVRAATGSRDNRRVDLMLAAWRGERGRVADLTRICRRLAAEDGETRVHATIAYSHMLMHNGTGRYTEAVRAFDSERTDIGFDPYVVPEAVEAAVRTGHTGEARRALDRLTTTTGAAGTPWAAGTEARCRALLAGHRRDAEEHYRRSIDALTASAGTVQLARGRLLYGEWLRRARRHAEAREELQLAHDELTRIGAGAFAGRAARELRALGTAPRARTAGGSGLTAHQLAVAQLLSQGATTREIAATLVVSTRTVDAHLRAIFGKLGVRSRREVGPALTDLLQS